MMITHSIKERWSIDSWCYVERVTKRVFDMQCTVFNEKYETKGDF